MFNASLLARSFDLCGITQNEVAECHQSFNSVYTNGIFEQIEKDDETGELNAFNEGEPAALIRIQHKKKKTKIKPKICFTCIIVKNISLCFLIKLCK